MTVLVGVVSQKGGVGKSTLARLIAREYAAAGWDVKIADLDISQGTSTDWKQRREQNCLQPEIAVEPFRTIAQALKHADVYDLMVLDGAPHSMQGTLEIARSSALLVVPTGLSLDDLKPSVLLAHELVKAHIPETKSPLPFAESETGTTKSKKPALTFIKRAIAPSLAQFQKRQLIDRQAIAVALFLKSHFPP
jgi:chromosome partitioning protein